MALLIIARFTRESSCWCDGISTHAVLYAQIKGVVFYDLFVAGAGKGEKLPKKKLPTVAQNSEYLLKLHYLGMKSGSTYPTGMHFLCLTPGYLENYHFAPLCRNCRCVPNLYLAQRYQYRVWYYSTSWRPQFTWRYKCCA